MATYTNDDGLSIGGEAAVEILRAKLDDMCEAYRKKEKELRDLDDLIYTTKCKLRDME